MQWFHRTGNVTIKQTTHDIGKLLEDLSEPTPHAPRKPRPQHYYSRRYFNERIKPTFEQVWAKVSTAPVPPGEKAPTRLGIQNKVTSDCWDKEPKEFKEYIQSLIDDEHQKVMAEYAAAKPTAKEPQTPEDYHQ